MKKYRGTSLLFPPNLCGGQNLQREAVRRFGSPSFYQCSNRHGHRLESTPSHHWGFRRSRLHAQYVVRVRKRKQMTAVCGTVSTHDEELCKGRECELCTPTVSISPLCERTNPAGQECRRSVTSAGAVCKKTAVRAFMHSSVSAIVITSGKMKTRHCIHQYRTFLSMLTSFRRILRSRSF